MASPNDIQSPTVSATPENTSPKVPTPLTQEVHSNTSSIFDDTPVVKMEISPPLLVAPGKGYGKILEQGASIATNHHSEADNVEMELASPIFSHGAQYPALDGGISEDIMEGVEQASNFGTEGAENTKCEEKIAQVLAPNANNPPEFSQAGVDLESRVQIEWIGTSTFFLEHNLELQRAVSFREHAGSFLT
jgi:hypothetical protein